MGGQLFVPVDNFYELQVGNNVGQFGTLLILHNTDTAWQAIVYHAC